MANLDCADLGNAHLSGTWFHEANLRGANFTETQADGASFAAADLSGAKLIKAELSGANLASANLTDADLSEAGLVEAVLVETNCRGTNLTGCHVYGVSVWGVELEGAIQSNLVITPAREPTIQVDRLEMAQFIYLLLNNETIRHVIDTITSKVVLILGRFTPERKAVLEAVREELRKRDYLPVVFDFEKPSSRDLTETVSTLAHMAKFVIADLTDPRSLPQELATIVPHLRSVPVQPILLASEQDWGMYTDLTAYPWVLQVVPYETTAELLANLAERVIGPAERWLAAGKPGG